MIWSTRCLLSALALAVFLSGNAALAAEATQAEVKAKLKEAQKAYDLTHFDEALSLFSEAYELKPLPGILFNIAQCHRHLSNWERAAFFYRRYLSLSPTKPRNAAEANSLLAEMEQEQAAAEKRKEEAELAERQKRELALARLHGAPGSEAGTPPTTTGNPADWATPPPPPPTGEAQQAAATAATQKAVTEVTVATPAGGLQPSGEVERHATTSDSLLTKWWFWTGVGVVAAGIATTAYVLSAPKPQNGSLPGLNPQ
jgi:tetratricopeptide (TPR) repeat protein